MIIALPILLTLVSGAGLALIIGQKWRTMALLDVENIPAVKEAKKKNEILKNKIESLALAAKARRMIKWWAPLLVRFRGLQQRFRDYVNSVESRMHAKAKLLRAQESPEKREARADDVKKFLSDGAFALEQGEIESAEKHFLSAIRLDKKNRDAYAGLADVYAKQGHAEEAVETFKFLLKLDPSNDAVYAKLADLSEQMGDSEQAVRYLEQSVILNDGISSRFAKLSELLSGMKQYSVALESAKQAAELEPQNPKYLDSLIEIAILAADRQTAEEAWQALRMVNPDNQKLPALKEKIEHLPR